MEKMNNAKNWILSHKILSGVILIVLAFIFSKVFFGSGKTEATVAVKRGDVIQKVIVNGNTKAVNSVDLGFQVSGTVARVNADIGTRVSTGQTIIALESGDLNAQYMRAQANVISEKAKLDELKRGTRPEELAVAQTSLDNAKTTLSDAQVNLRDKVADFVGNNIDQMFSNPKTNNPQINLVVSDSQLKTDVNNGRGQVENILNNWQLDKAGEYLPTITTFIDNVAKVVNNQSANQSLSQTTLDGYKTSVSTAKSTLITYRDALSSAKSALVLVQKNYDLKKSGSTPEAISSQEAKVLQAEADVQSALAQLNKTSIRSPQNGIITKLDISVGEVVTSGTKIVSIISDSDLEIESNVSEVSIGKVAVGNPVDITFDAFPGEVFKGKVSYIEPGETVVDGVVNYKVKVAFDQKYPQVKSGLTSKLEIITSSKQGVLYVPQYSVLNKEDGAFVMKKTGKTSMLVKVSTGIKGQDGSTEIISGLNEGEEIFATPESK